MWAEDNQIKVSPDMYSLTDDYFAENNELNFSIEDKKEECDFKEIFYEKICNFNYFYVCFG